MEHKTIFVVEHHGIGDYRIGDVFLRRQLAVVLFAKCANATLDISRLRYFAQDLMRPLARDNGVVVVD
jgi:hypothetical protein